MALHIIILTHLIKDDLQPIVEGFSFEPYTQKIGFIVAPIEFTYAFEDWMFINTGLDNKFSIWKSDKDFDNEKYVLGINGGIDFKIYDNYLIGVNYNKDLTPIWIPNKDIDISYYSNQFTVKLAYILD